jgi:hypothetical protein
MTSLPYLNTGIHFADYSLTVSSKKVKGLSLTAKQEVKRSVPRIEERYYLIINVTEVTSYLQWPTSRKKSPVLKEISGMTILVHTVR